MNILGKMAATSVASLSFIALDASAAIDQSASVVLLRTSCNNGAGGDLNNCFANMPSLQSYIYITRTNKAAPLLIDIGPGVYTAGSGWSGFECVANSPAGNSGSNGGNLTFRGAGIDKTILSGNPFGILNHCPNSNWSFENLTVNGGRYSVIWGGDGNSNWSNVVMKGGWFDFARNGGNQDVCPAGQQGIHRFFSSRIVAKSGYSYSSVCGDSWFWGSELISPSDNSGGLAIQISGPGNRLHLYGSNIRLEASSTAVSSTTTQQTAIIVGNNAEVHMHGVGIDLIGKDGWTLTALDASSGGQIHADVSSYFVQPSTGITFRRIVNNGGHVHAPYVWQHTPTFTFESITGADTSTVTTGTSDGQPHTAVYSTTCPSGANWYDQVDKVCRSQ